MAREKTDKAASKAPSFLAVSTLVILLSFLGGCRGLVTNSGGGGGGGGGGTTGLKKINHIIFMAQENRGFDHYFGAMRQYWAANNIPDQSFDGLPQFNPASGIAPLQGPALSNPGCDPTQPPPSDCVVDGSNPISSFHMVSMCEENPSPSWNESHVDWNVTTPLSATHTLDGFVFAAAHDARMSTPAFSDVNGLRAMSYYDGTDLPYYYSLATNFATSDRWFSPVMSRTTPNRLYMLAGTSAGHAYPLISGTLSVPTIFDELQAAGVSWRVYVTDLQYANPPVNDSALTSFDTAAKYPQNMVPISQYFTDLTNGTLPAVAFIDPGFNSGRDEHPGLDDNQPSGSVQVGAQYVSTIIDALMQSSAWKDSAFILTYDEGGGFADHVAPLAALSPDGIPPIDLLPGDFCTPPSSGANCDFTRTGYRVPITVISPFAKKNYVSHTPADHTAWLKLVETRFGLSNLTARDFAQMDMTEFFDFANPPWTVPPTNLPVQPTNGQCYLNQLP